MFLIIFYSLYLKYYILNFVWTEMNISNSCITLYIVHDDLRDSRQYLLLVYGIPCVCGVCVCLNIKDSNTVVLDLKPSWTIPNWLISSATILSLISQYVKASPDGVSKFLVNAFNPARNAAFSSTPVQHLQPLVDRH